MRQTPSVREDNLSDQQKKTYRRNKEIIDLIVYGWLKGNVPFWVHGKPDIVFFLDETQFKTQSTQYSHQAAIAALQADDAIKPSLVKRWRLDPHFFDDENVRAMAAASATADPGLQRIIKEICAWAADVQFQG
jgi:hypothetical protein